MNPIRSTVAIALLFVGCAATPETELQTAPTETHETTAPAPSVAPASRAPASASAVPPLAPPENTAKRRVDDRAVSTAAAPTVHPVVEAFVRAVKTFDSNFEKTELDLSGTSEADTGRVLTFIEYRLRALAIKALASSPDPRLRELRGELTRIPAFIEVPTAHVNLKMGPFEPLACVGCDVSEDACKRPTCVAAMAALLPAELSAGGLRPEMEFAGHPTATSEGVDSGEEITIAEYFEALDDAHVPHDEIAQALADTARDLVLRSRFIESRSALEPHAGEPTAWATLRTGFERWKRVYGKDANLQAPSAPKALDDDGFALQRGFVSAEPALYQRFGWPRLKRHIRSRLRLHDLYLKSELASARGKEPADPGDTEKDNEYAGDEEACLEGSPALGRACDETEAAVLLLEDVMVEGSSPQTPEALAQSAARAFELLTLSGLSPAEIAKFVEIWAKNAVWAP